MIRSFEVKALNSYLVCDLSRDLDRKLVDLQNDGWKIISVTPSQVKEYDSYRGKFFDSTLFTILAEKEENAVSEDSSCNKKTENSEDLVVRGDEVIVSATIREREFKGIFYGESNDYYWILVDEDIAPQKIPKNEWTLTKTGKYVDIFK